MGWQQRLKRKLDEDEQECRLVNWGRWHRRDNTMVVMLYPTWPQIMKEYFGASRVGLMVADLDAEHLEDIISTLDISGRGGFGWGELYAFVLKLEYIEKPENAQRPVSERAKHVRRKFGRPCAERTYQHHVQNAKKAVFTFAEPIFFT